MAHYPGFIGSSHRLRSVNVNTERTVNFYVERGTGTPKSREWLAPTPGLEPFCVLSSGPVRTLFYMDGRAFAVGGIGFYEVFSNGTATLRGSLNQNAFPATISSNGSNGGQLMITSAGINWIYDLTDNTFVILGPDAPTRPTRMSTFSDGYFLALRANSNEFQISALYDGTTWDGLDVFQVSTVADQVVAMVESHRDIWLLGSQTSSVWSNTGDADVPYQPVPGVKIEQGCGAAFSAIPFDNAIMWLGSGEAGNRIVWRANGYTPERVSTHAVEYALNQARRIDDAVAWSYQQEGHTFYVLYVPDLAHVRDFATTWVYDVATNEWHERALWDSVRLDWQPHVGRCHAFAFGRHLIGAWNSGAIYEMRVGLASDSVLLVADKVQDDDDEEPPFIVPTLVSVSPATGEQGGSVAMTLTGTGFVAGATTVTISGTGVTATEIVVSGSTSLTATFVITEGATVSARTVTVTTAAGTSGTQPFGVTEQPAAVPTLTTVVPADGDQGDAVSVTLTGTNFIVGATTVDVSGAGVTAGSVVVASATSLTATFTITGGAALGARNVTVTTAEGTSNAQTFTVTTVGIAAPTFTSITPNNGDQDEVIGVTLVGTNFIIGATTVNISGTGVTVSNVVVSSTTSLTADFDIDIAATLSGRTVTVTTAGGTSSGRTFTVTDPGAPVGDRDLLVASDLTFAGQQNLDHNYSNLALAIRYVAAERRLLIYNHGGAAEGVGDLIEYKENVAGLKNGGSHWTVSNVPNFTEVRRWRNWSTKDRIIAGSYPAIFQADGGNGAWPSSFYWDEAQGLLWYTFQPVYPGGGTTWPSYSAVKLEDSEAIVVGSPGTAGYTVSGANIKGPYYFKDAASASSWKSASSGLIPIPAERQAAMGAAFLNAGHHAANIGTDGPRSLSFWMHGDLPTPPAQDATILTDAVHIYDTGSGSGATPCQMRIPNLQFQCGGHASQGVGYKDVAGVQSPIGEGHSLPLTTGSLLYQYEYGDSNCLTVFMANTSAAGGAWVPEVYTASGWIVPPGWAMAAGTQQLSGLENVFYWPTVAMVAVQPIAAQDANFYVRLRQTGTGTNGGSVKAFIFTSSLPTSDAYADRPGDPDGTYNVLGTEQYDADHYSTCYEEFLFGGAWVRTSNVEGIAYFGPLRCGAQWYGGAPAWFQPVGTGLGEVGTPVKRHYATAAESFGNGGKSEGPMYPFFFTFDAEKIIECAAGTRDRNADGLQPEAFWRMPDEWADIIFYGQVNNPSSPFYPSPSFSTYGNGSTVVYDPVAQQLIVWFTNGTVYSGYGIVAFFDVR